MKKLALFFVLISCVDSVMAYRVISRTVDRCASPNFWGREQCSHTERDLVEYEVEGRTKYGWAIDCWGNGSSSCPKHLPIGDLPDEDDVTWSNFLLDYYDEQINFGNYSGTHSITVLLLNGQYAYYTLSWEYSESNGEVSGFINIDRN